MHEQASQTLVELTKLLAAEATTFQGWQRAYLRYEASATHTGMNGSCTCGPETVLIGAIKHAAFYETVEPLFERLRDEVASRDGRLAACLLILDSSLDFKLLIEPHDSTRWAISKLNGASGVPIGVEA